MPTPEPDDSPDPAGLAARLHDAQVAWVLAELTGDRFADAVAEDVGRVLEVAATMRLGEVVAVTDVQAIARRLVVDITSSPAVTALAESEAPAVRRVLAEERAALGEVLDRDHVEAFVARAVQLHDARDHVLDQLTRSPAAIALTSRLVTQIVADVLTQNRARAEKVPGVSSLLSLGSGAVSRVSKVGLGDYQLDRLVGDAMGAGAQYTMKRTTGIVRDLVTDAAILEVAMELWDQQAAQPVGDLVAVVGEDDVADLVPLVRALLEDARGTEVASRVVDTAVAVFFEEYAGHDLAALLGEIGISSDQLVEDVRRIAPPVLEAARADGVLERVVRARLAPFWDSPAVAEMLSAPPT